VPLSADRAKLTNTYKRSNDDTPDKMNSGSKRSRNDDSNDARSKRLKQQLMQQPREERRQQVESGKIKFRSRFVRVSNMRLIRANHCTVYGDNNHIEGNGNRIVGRNNTARGLHNVFERKQQQQQQQRSDQTRSRSTTTPQPSRSVVLTLADQITDAVDTTHSPSSVPPTQNNALTSIMPTTGTDSRSKHWKCSVLDLEGNPQPASSEELRCCICLENRFDTLFEPCHHLCCCRACAKKLFSVDKPTKCPICKKTVQWSSIVF